MTLKSPLSPHLGLHRRSLLLGAAGALLASPALGEGGEGGESGATEGLPENVGFLVELGLFEAAYRLVTAMAQAGAAEAAAEQYEFSHHAHYDDIADGILSRGFPSMLAITEEFGGVVMAQEAPETIAARLEDLLLRIVELRASFTPAERMHAVEALVRVAAMDFEAGVSETGEMLSEHEYRDAWGFMATVQAELEHLGASDDPAVADAVARATSALEPAWGLFPSVMAQSTEIADASRLYGAAARIEIARLRL